MGRFLRRRSGFSLIELLIVVAIIAALVGVAVPFFQDNLSEAQRTKAKQDLEIIKKSIALYDAREPRPLTGTDLKPLLGRYMQEQPKDPWGNDYLFDGAVGFVCSYGADALPLGSGGDTDITIYTKPPLMLTRAQYQGSWGRPRPVALVAGNLQHATGNKFIVTMTKPFAEGPVGTSHEGEFVLLTNLASQNGTFSGGAPKQLSASTANDFVANTWKTANTTAAGTNRDPIHRADVGIAVIQCNADNSTDSLRQAVTPTMALDFDCVAATGQKAALAAPNNIIETHYPAGATPTGPMDPTVYGAEAYNTYKRDPQCVELVNSERRGVRLEKY